MTYFKMLAIEYSARHCVVFWSQMQSVSNKRMVWEEKEK